MDDYKLQHTSVNNWVLNVNDKFKHVYLLLGKATNPTNRLEHNLQGMRSYTSSLRPVV